MGAIYPSPRQEARSYPARGMTYLDPVGAGNEEGKGIENPRLAPWAIICRRVRGYGGGHHPEVDPGNRGLAPCG